MIQNDEIKIKQPHSFSREENDTYRWQERLTTGTTGEFNQKSQTQCYNTECNNTLLEYDYNRDELTCPLCGYVQRQAFTDYAGNEGLYQITSQEKKNKKLRKKL